MNKRTLAIFVFLLSLLVGSFAQAQQITVTNRIDILENTEPPAAVTQGVLNNDWLLELNFKWADQVGGALFYYDDQIWIVFDKFIEFSLKQVRENALPFVTSIYQRNSANGTVLVLSVDKKYHYKLIPDYNDWNFRAYNFPVPKQQIYQPRVIQTPEKGKILIVSDPKANGVVGTVDGNTGSILLIGTTLDNNIGVSGMQRYQGFNFINTMQGVVVESFIDNLSLKSQRDGFHLDAIDGLPLSLSDTEQEEVLDGEVFYSTRPIFNWGEWHGDANKSFIEKLDKHYQFVSSVSPENINDARTSLAQYYLSYLFGSEAKGIIDIMFNDYPFLYELPEIRALYAVSLFLGRRYEKALEVLDHEGLKYLSEILLWKGAIYAKLRQWEDAEEAFAISERFILDYPLRMRFTLALLRLESAIQNKQEDVAAGWLTFVKNIEYDFHEIDQAKIDFLDALYIVTFNDDPVEATKIFQRLRLSRNKLVNTRARYNLTRLLYEENKIDIRTAIKELNSVRYGWRGDVIEAEIILTLAEYYLKNQQYYDGLNLLRSGVSYINNDHFIERMTLLMEEEFIRLFYDGQSDTMSVTAALSLYNDFRELTPPGRTGNYIIERLAMRLLSIDLLEQAIFLLEYQIKYRLEGQERGRVGTKLALYYILDGLPEKAIAVIDNTRFPGLPNQLLAERRRILAKAFIELENYSRARRLLVGDVSRDAELLRLEIFWQQQDWFEVANVLRRLIEPAPTNLSQDMSETNARLVLNLAVALKLIDDHQGLKTLRNAYLPFMERSFYGRLFNTLTASDLDDVNLGADGNLLQQISGEEFNLFINRYRERILTPTEEFLGLQNRALDSEALENVKIEDTENGLDEGASNPLLLN